MRNYPDPVPPGTTVYRLYANGEMLSATYVRRKASAYYVRVESQETEEKQNGWDWRDSREEALVHFVEMFFPVYSVRQRGRQHRLAKTVVSAIQTFIVEEANAGKKLGSVLKKAKEASEELATYLTWAQEFAAAIPNPPSAGLNSESPSGESDRPASPHPEAFAPAV